MEKGKVEYYQFIYALHSADYIEGEVTKIIETLAPIFGIELAKSWQSGFDHSINDNGKDYKPKIFEELQKGYENYVKRRFFEKVQKNK